jgi:putative ABC transport system permease protein
MNLRQWLTRLRALARGGDLDRDFGQELQSHLDMLTDDNIANGMTPQEARRQASIRLGAMSSLQSQHRDVRGYRLLDELAQDLSFAIRLMTKEPWLSAAAIVSLTIGIGATTTIFTIINGVLLRPLPYPEPERLAGIVQRHSQYGSEFATLPDFNDWRDHNSTLSAIGGAWPAAFNMSGSDEPERLSGAFVTPGFFDAFAVEPVLGGVLRHDDTSLIVIGNDLWRRRFNGSADVVGRRVELNNRAYTVAGVMPAGFGWPPATDVWLPLVPEASMNRGYHMLQVVGRLRPSASLEEARADLTALASASSLEYPATNKDWSVDVQSLLQATVGGASRSLWLLAGATVLLLVIACANVANLLASRAVSRRLELSIRGALGASRLRLLRQLLTEGFLFAACGGLCALAVAAWTVSPLLSLTTLPRAAEVSLDWRVFVAAVAASMLTALAIGAITASRGARASLRDVDTTRGTTRTGWLRPALVMVQVSLVVILLAGTGLLIRSFVRLQNVDVGFDSSNVLTLRFFLPRAGYPADRAIRLYEDLIEGAKGIRGVKSAAAVSSFPMSGTTPNVAFSIASQPSTTSQELSADFAAITTDYFDTIGVRTIAGRIFTPFDSGTAPFVAVVTQSMAERFFPGQDPIGQSIRILGPRPRTIVGVVSDTRQRRLDAPAAPQIYVPHAQQPLGGMFLAVRTVSTPLEPLVADLRARIRSIDANLPIASIRTADELLGSTLSSRRFNMLLLTLFSGTALLLAVVGIYGVLSYAVAQRRMEIGIRMALGAQRARVMMLMLSQGMWPVVAGLAIGTIAALAATTVIESMLFEVAARDPLTLAATAALLLVVALIAAVVPAHRAARVDPKIALQS